MLFKCFPENSLKNYIILLSLKLRDNVRRFYPIFLVLNVARNSIIEGEPKQS